MMDIDILDFILTVMFFTLVIGCPVWYEMHGRRWIMYRRVMRLRKRQTHEKDSVVCQEKNLKKVLKDKILAHAGISHEVDLGGILVISLSECSVSELRYILRKSGIPDGNI